MSQETMNKIKDYLKTLEDEEREIREKESQLEKKDAPLPQKARETPAPCEKEEDAVVREMTLQSAPSQDVPAEKQITESVSTNESEPVVRAHVQQQNASESPAETSFTEARRQSDNDRSKAFETVLSSKMEKEEQQAYLSPDEVAKDLYEKTEKVLGRYSPAFVAQNIENTQMMITLLEKTSSMLPFNVDFELRGKIDRNISTLRDIVSNVDSNIRKQEEVRILEEYLQEVDKALRRFSRPQIVKNLERSQYEYNVLLQKKKTLPVGNPTYEMVVSKRLGELESRIMSVVELSKVKSYCEELDVRTREFLKNSETEDFEILKEEYRSMLSLFRQIEDDIDKNKQNAIKEGLYHCKLRLQKRRKLVEQELKQKRIVEENVRKEEYRGIRTFWREYVNDLKMFNDTVTVASPSQYFTLYERYNKLVGLYSNLTKNELISSEEVQQADGILSHIDRKLEYLRQHI